MIQTNCSLTVIDTLNQNPLTLRKFKKIVQLFIIPENCLTSTSLNPLDKSVRKIGKKSMESFDVTSIPLRRNWHVDIFQQISIVWVGVCWVGGGGGGGDGIGAVQDKGASRYESLFATEWTWRIYIPLLPIQNSLSPFSYRSSLRLLPIQPLRAFSFRYFSMYREISGVLRMPTHSHTEANTQAHTREHSCTYESPSGSRIHNPQTARRTLVCFKPDTCTYFNPFQIHLECLFKVLSLRNKMISKEEKES